MGNLIRNNQRALVREISPSVLLNPHSHSQRVEHSLYPHRGRLISTSTCNTNPFLCLDFILNCTQGAAIPQLPQQYTIWLKLPGDFGHYRSLLYNLHLERHKANHPTPVQSWTRILQVLTCHCQKRQPCQKSKLLSARNPIKGSIENPRVSLQRQLWTSCCVEQQLWFSRDMSEL